MELVFAALAEVIINDVAQRPQFAKLRQHLQGGSPEKRALEEALIETYEQFCDRYVDLSNAFFDQHFLTKPVVKGEIAKLLTPEQNPSISTIEQAWKEQFGSQPELSIAEPITFFIDVLKQNINAKPQLKDYVDSRFFATIAQNTERTASGIAELVRAREKTDERIYEQQYLEKFRHIYKGVEETYIPLAGTSTSTYSPKRPLKSVHPDARIAFELRRELQETFGNSGNIEHSLEDVLQIIDHTKQVVILGDPGSGKTTILRQLGTTLVLKARGDLDAPIPVLINLGALTADKTIREEIQAVLGQVSLETLEVGKRIAYIFDGLNELPQDNRNSWKDEIAAIVTRAKRDQITVVVTCREMDYSPLDLNMDVQIRVKPLDPSRIREFCLRYFEHENDALELFWSLAGGPHVRRRWEELQEEGVSFHDFWTDENLPPEIASFEQEILDNGDWRWRKVVHPKLLLSLARNPYMLFMIIQVFSETGELPKNRGALFDIFIRMLFRREKHSDEQSAELQTKLANLAFDIQKNEKGTSVDRDYIHGFLNEKDLHLARSANLLDVDVQTRFSHQLLQEYFAARFLQTNLESGVSASEFFPENSWWERQGWEETILLLAGLFNDDATTIINWLKDAQPELAARCITKSGANVPTSTIESLQPSWQERILQQGESVYARAAIGRALGMLTLDKRYGVGNSGDFPEIDWCTIEPGEAIVGGDDNVLDTFYPSPMQKIEIEYTYWISKYPITFAQFEPFVEHGYTTDDYWTPAGLEWRGDRKKPVYWLDDYWHISNHPIVGITWYEAVAFSNWLNQTNLKITSNANQNNIIRLPTEIEWEKAARGTHRQFFSYGNLSVPEAANHYSKLPEPVPSEYPTVYSSSGPLDELLEDRKRIRYLGRTSAVGIFTQDRSPYGLMDICGNVWEWTISKWRQKYIYPDLDQLEGDQKRVLKGGAWEFNSAATRCASRGRNSPDVVKPIIGFRVVLAPNL